MTISWTLAKRAVGTFGFTISRRDRLAEQIPDDYLKSPVLPRIYRQSMARLFYFKSMFEAIVHVPGDIVECGVSTGYGILTWALLCDLTASERTIWGFDSFTGFPPGSEHDRKNDNTFHVQEHDWASPPELVMRVLTDGRVSRDTIAKRIRLIPGLFETTLRKYQGRIALLHLDCDLFQSYTVCLNALYSSVNPGGVIMFDEYDDPNFPGAKTAVDLFLRDKPEEVRQYQDFAYRKAFIIKC